MRVGQPQQAHPQRCTDSTIVDADVPPRHLAALRERGVHVEVAGRHD